MVVSRIRMPLFAYCAVVAPALLGLLFAAEALLGPPGPMALSSDGPVLVKRQSAETDSVKILTVRDSLEVPDSALAAAGEQPRRSAAVALRPASQPAVPARPAASAGESRKRVAAETKRSAPRIAREGDRRDLYAFEPRQRSFFSVW